MQRALSSGVTGMLTNQLALDVTSNNLANVNTPGFKGSRVSFSTSLIQTTFAGSAAGNNVGGLNPRQVGLGVAGGSIEVNMNQGALQSTGRNLDVAIQGEGFFEVTDGTRSFYTRVGNFGLDESNNLVHLTTGYRLIGNRYNLEADAEGNQTLDAGRTNSPLEVPVDDAFPPRRTSQVDFQGNLSSETNALRGSALQSIYTFTNSVTGNAATEDTSLTDLSIFKGNAVGLTTETRTIYAYGTRPNGEAYAGSFEINPYAVPTAGDNSGTLGQFIAGINGVLAQGSDRFATARLENGNLILTGVENGDGLSLFFGEGDPDVDATTGLPAAGFNNPIPTKSEWAGGGATPIGNETNPATVNLTASIESVITDTAAVAGDVGLLDPYFEMPATNLTATVGISVLVNGISRGQLVIPPQDFTAATQADRQFRLPSYPHIANGDEIEYRFISTADLNGITARTYTVADNNTTNFTQDSDSDGLPDLFQNDAQADPNAWQYLNRTNETFDWYRRRTIPDFVTSSIEVFDAQGGRHSVEARFFRIGTRTEGGTGAQINSWDMMANIDSSEGTIIDDLVTSIEFDQQGRFIGLGSTVSGTPMSELTHVGNPVSQNIQIDWAATGPTQPATIAMEFGESRTFNGLTGFGSTSTAAAVEQDGYEDGRLDNLSIGAEGDITALYTNGISRRLAQIPITTFRNPEGLTSTEGNLWQRSTASGDPVRRVPGENAGFLTASALEGSNVDIATEFTRLINSQRGFQVSARVIQTTDEILEELANLTR
jgi:flagellar hook protein FlgE